MAQAAPFNYPFPSRHSPEEVWEALTTPLSAELNHVVNSPRVNLAYENLGEDGHIAKGTRLTYTPNLAMIGFVEKRLLKLAPDEGTGIVDTVSADSKIRVDIVEPGQSAKGHMEYRVEEDKGCGVLLVSGEFAITGLAGAIARGAWPPHLEDMDAWLIKYGIHNPAQRLLEHLPEILAASK